MPHDGAGRLQFGIWRRQWQDRWAHDDNEDFMFLADVQMGCKVLLFDFILLMGSQWIKAMSDVCAITCGLWIPTIKHKMRDMTTSKHIRWPALPNFYTLIAWDEYDIREGIHSHCTSSTNEPTNEMDWFNFRVWFICYTIFNDYRVMTENFQLKIQWFCGLNIDRLKIAINFARDCQRNVVDHPIHIVQHLHR